MGFRPRPIVWAVGVLGLAAPATLALVPATDMWERAHFSVTAYVALLLAWVGLSEATTPRVRAVRGWIAVAVGVWTVLHVLKNLEYSLGPLPVAADALLLPVAVAAAAAYWAVVAGRMPWREQLAVYLDAAVVGATASAALLVLLGERALVGDFAIALLYAVVFVAIFAATVILDLAVLAELSPRGAYAILGGLALAGTGFVLRAGDASAVATSAFDSWLTSAGILVIGYGTATWNDRVDPNARYTVMAGRVRSLLPLAAATIALLLLARPQSEDALARVVVLALVTFALIGTVVRQSLLLWEREGVLGRLAAARSAAERRTQQIAGMEAVGRLLAAAGPTDEILDQVVELIGERFGYTNVALYLRDGDVLRLGAQRGYIDLYPTFDGKSGIVGRVMRNRSPELVRDVPADADYLMADPAVRSEICAPLLADDEFLGIVNVESSADDPLDETDLAAVVAVADQLASAIALGLRRQRLLHERNFTSAVLDTVGALVIVTDPDGKVVRFNPACAEVSGYSVEELAELESFAVLVPPEQRAGVELIVADVQAGGTSRSVENDWLRKDGSRRSISWWNRPVLAEDGTVDYVIATGTDITQRKQLETQLAHRALHDALTGLPNRALLMDRIRQALRRRSNGSITAALFIDLDDFKQINDVMGHAAGDVVLVEIARRLVGALRAGDTAARVGGDEFAIVVNELPGEAEAVAAAERVRNAAFGKPILVGDRPVRIDGSVGIATTIARPEGDPDRLLANADIAMYAAKAGGGGRCEVFRPHMHAEIVRRREVQVRLSAAIENNQFLLHYQPIVRLSGRRLIGAESLLRWNDPQKGLVLPAQFLHVAEQSGLILPIGVQALRQACQQMARWLRDAPATAPEWISVNVSPRQLEDADHFDVVVHALREADLEPRRLVIEITEGVMVDGSGTTREMLLRLSELGVRFAVDDFGTGYSSLSYLRRFPIEFLKIDQSFIPGVDTDQQQAAFVGALVAMGRTLGLRVLAEGVETDAQYRALRQLGCELGQGYYLGMPVAGDDFRVRSSAEAPETGPPNTKSEAAVQSDAAVHSKPQPSHRAA